jgi:hypothetical protein
MLDPAVGTFALVLTVIVTGLEVAGFPVAQDKFEVITQVIKSLLTGV